MTNNKEKHKSKNLLSTVVGILVFLCGTYFGFYKDVQIVLNVYLVLILVGIFFGTVGDLIGFGNMVVSITSLSWSSGNLHEMLSNRLLHAAVAQGDTRHNNRLVTLMRAINAAFLVVYGYVYIAAALLISMIMSKVLVVAIEKSLGVFRTDMESGKYGQTPDKPNQPVPEGENNRPVGWDQNAN